MYPEGTAKPSQGSGLNTACEVTLYGVYRKSKGVPVATVAIGNAANAALLAVRMLGMEDASLADAMVAYQARMEAEVLAKAERLEAVGWQAYLQQQPKKM